MASGVTLPNASLSPSTRPNTFPPVCRNTQHYSATVASPPHLTYRWRKRAYLARRLRRCRTGAARCGAYTGDAATGATQASCLCYCLPATAFHYTMFAAEHGTLPPFFGQDHGTWFATCLPLEGQCLHAWRYLCSYTAASAAARPPHCCCRTTNSVALHSQHLGLTTFRATGGLCHAAAAAPATAFHMRVPSLKNTPRASSWPGYWPHGCGRKDCHSQLSYSALMTYKNTHAACGGQAAGVPAM